MIALGPCAACGRNPAAGYAGRWTNEAGEQWFCHGDDDESPTCYESFVSQPAWMPMLAEAMERPLDPDAFGVSPASQAMMRGLQQMENRILTDFLLARIAEDEDRARSLPDVPLDATQFAAGHVVVHPRRFLADCRAKRRIVGACAQIVGRPGSATLDEMFVWDACWFTLASLGTVYADHPDYRDEWRP